MRRSKLITTLLVGGMIVLAIGRAPAAYADDTRITDDSVSVSLSSAVASATGVTATVTFTTNAAMFDGSVIALTLGTFNLDSVSGSTITSSSLTGTGSTQIAGSSKILLFTTSAFAAAGTQTITISGITNPTSAGTATLVITTQGISGLSSGLTEAAITSITDGSGGGEGDFDEGDEGGDFGGGAVTGDNSVTITVNDETGTALASQNVFAYCGMSYQSGVTDSSGQATISSLANGNCGVWLTSSSYWAEEQHFTFSSTDEAKTEAVTLTASALDTTVRTTVTNPDGSVAEGIYVFLTDTAGREFYGATDGNGQVSLGVFYDTYTLNGYIGSQESDYYLPETTFTVSSTGITADSNIHDVAVTLREFDSFVTVTQTDSNGTVIPTGRLLIYSEAGMRFTQNEADGTITVGVIPGTYTVKGEATGYANTAQKNVVVNEGETTTVTLAMADAPNTLNLTMVDVNGATVASSGYVFCKDPAATFEPAYVYFGFMSEGTASFTFPDGDWQCNANVTGYVSANPTFTMSGNETETGEIILTAYDATITVNVVDQDGNAINSMKYGVFGEAADGTAVSGYSMGGSVAMGVIGDKTYTLRAYVMDGGYTSDYNNPTEVTVADGDSASATITVYATPGTVTGTVTDADGNAISDAAVKASCTTKAGKTFEFTGNTDTTGDYSLDVVNGDCVLNATNDEDLPSGDESENISNGENVDHDLQLQESNATLKVTPVGASNNSIMALEVDSGSCYAYNAAGVYVTDEIDTTTGKASLPVLAGDWSYGCRVVVDDEAEVTTSDSTATVKIGDTTSAQASVDSADDNFANQVAQFSATSDTTFALPDGTEITIPANALDNSGNVSITASMATDIASEDDLAAGPAIELTARDSNNRPITGSFSGDVTIKFNYTTDMLEKYGLTEDDLAGGYSYNDGALAVTNQGYTIDKENNTVTVTTDHFSTFTLAGVKAAAPGKAKSLKVKKITTNSAKLTWKAPSTGEVTKYKVQTRKHGVKKISKWTTYKKVTKTNKAIKKLLASTRYQFRVKACNGTECSAYTDWKAFKTTSE